MGHLLPAPNELRMTVFKFGLSLSFFAPTYRWPNQMVSIKIGDQGNDLDDGALVYSFHRWHCYDSQPLTLASMQCGERPPLVQSKVPWTASSRERTVLCYTCLLHCVMLYLACVLPQHTSKFCKPL